MTGEGFDAAATLARLDAEPAVVLREVAAEIRRRAQAASPGPYVEGGYGDYGPSVLARSGFPRNNDLLGIETSDTEQGWADAAHLASWAQPETASAVADLLDEVAGRAQDAGCNAACCTDNAAITVARVWLEGQVSR